jgi:NAD(P)-dependent dehydrogenase (short-subunit alcohol dehydrogenase family)
LRGLSGKAATVSGGANGIGHAIVECLCQEGVSITFSGISDAGYATERELKDRGHPVRFVRSNMADEASCRQLVEECVTPIAFLLSDEASIDAGTHGLLR